MRNITAVYLGHIFSAELGKHLELTGEPIHVSNESVLYRYGDDEVHLVTDGAGGYRMIQNPLSEEPVITTGHLSDFSKNKSHKVSIIKVSTPWDCQGQQGTHLDVAVYINDNLVASTLPMNGDDTDVIHDVGVSVASALEAKPNIYEVEADGGEWEWDDIVKDHVPYGALLPTGHNTQNLDFQDDTTVIYIPENWDDETKEGYTAKDILDICGGDEQMAHRVYQQCEWQHPETILDEIRIDGPDGISDKQLDAILSALVTHCTGDEQLKAIADDIREKRTDSEFLLQTDIDTEQYAVKISDDVWIYSENSDRSAIGIEVPYDPYATEVMDFTNYTEEELEHWVCAYMPSLQTHKEAYGDNWKQIALECVFEQTCSYCNA